MFTLEITYEYVAFAAILSIVTYTTWRKGIREGASRLADHLENLGIIQYDEEKEETEEEG